MIHVDSLCVYLTLYYVLKWIKVDSDILRKLPEDMLNEQEVIFPIQNCRNQRDKTIIALFWDTGMRLGELLNLKIKNITQDR